MLLALFFGVLGTIIFNTLGRAQRMEDALAQAEIQRLQQERQLSEERLKTLQAQIEPHFLFNTLANVVGLVRTDPSAAEETLRQLTELLRNSLSRTRERSTTLGQELDLVQAYLRIQQVRMGDRLRFEVQAPDELRHLPLPPLLVQPLVENAVLHGIEPSESGGEVMVSARLQEGFLSVEVRDNGKGMNPQQPPGTGLANVRQRLRSLFGAEADLRLLEHSPRGVLAALRLPMAEAAEGS